VSNLMYPVGARAPRWHGSRPACALDCCPVSDFRAAPGTREKGSLILKRVFEHEGSEPDFLEVDDPAVAVL
jgi:hypothetical protein